jgi:hypothetical protein
MTSLSRVASTITHARAFSRRNDLGTNLVFWRFLHALGA